MSPFGRALLLAGIASLLSRVAPAQELTDAEFKCQQKVSKASATFVDKKTKCATKCLKNFWKGENPATDCLSPFGGATAECVNDTITDKKGVEDKLRDAILKNCDPATKDNTDCPECYSGGDCSVAGEASDRVQNLESQVDVFGPLVFCETTDASEEEQACQLNAAKTLAKLVKSIDKCYDKCFKAARKDEIDVATCAPPATDPPTDMCIATARDKAIAGVDKKCGDVGAAPDNCGIPYPDGASFANLVDIAIGGSIPTTYCPE